MHFEVGNVIIHATHGVGTIRGIEQKQFFEQESRMYYVISIKDGIIWAPVEDNGVSKLREVVSKAKLPYYRNLLRSRPVEMEKDYRKRREEISLALKNSSFEVLCTLVRDLTAMSWKKPLSEADAMLLQRIRQNLCQEWAESDGISLDQAVHELDNLLMEARKMAVAE